MAVTFSTATGNALMDTLAADALYVSLHTANPDGTGAHELSGNGYARQAANWAAAAAKKIQNPDIITFGLASADWAAVNHVGFWTAESGGSFVCATDLAAPVTVQDGESASFGIDQLILSLVALA